MARQVAFAYRILGIITGVAVQHMESLVFKALYIVLEEKMGCKVNVDSH